MIVGIEDVQCFMLLVGLFVKNISGISDRSLNRGESDVAVFRVSGGVVSYSIDSRLRMRT